MIFNPLLKNHDKFRGRVECRETLNQLGMVQFIHQLDFFTGRCFLSVAAGPVEFTGTHSTRLLVGHPVHLPKLPPADMSKTLVFKLTNINTDSKEDADTHTPSFSWTW